MIRVRSRFDSPTFLQLSSRIVSAGNFSRSPIVLVGVGFLLWIVGVDINQYVIWTATLSVGLLYAFVISVAILPLLLFIPGIFKAVFGFEFLLGAGCCTLAVDSVPDTIGMAKVITLPPVDLEGKGHLRHAIYAHPMCIEEIVRWIGDELAMCDEYASCEAVISARQRL